MPIAPYLNDPDHWHARVQAEQMSNEQTKQTMLQIAADYDNLAVRAAIRAGVAKED
jgi:hypothetical protein